MLFWRNLITLSLATIFGLTAWHHQVVLEQQRDRALELAHASQELAEETLHRTDKCLAGWENAKAVYDAAIFETREQLHELLRSTEKCIAVTRLVFRAPLGRDTRVEEHLSEIPAQP